MKEMDITVVIEGTLGEGFSCYVEEDVPYCSLIGVGDTIEECKEDFLICIEEVNEMAAEENITLPHYNIEWKMAS